MDDTEETEQQITYALQQIDLNFVTVSAGPLQHFPCFSPSLPLPFQALKAASELLKQVKDLEQHTSAVAQSLDAWRNFFHLFEDAQVEAAPAGEAAEEPNVSFSMSTPSMPKFSKSFAKTPMARAMNAAPFSGSETESIPSVLDDTALSRDLNTLSPPISTPFFKPSKTPGPEMHADDTPEATPTIHSPPVSTPFLQSARLPLRAESTGFNTPGTPPTPIDGDYGPASAAKSQILLFGTPAMLMSSGTRAAAQRRLRRKREEDMRSPVDENDPTRGNKEVNGLGMKVKGLGIHDAIQGTGTPLSVKLASRLKSCVPVEMDNGSMHEVDKEKEELLDTLVDNLEKEPPKFDIKLFPSLFQNGEGATQITVSVVTSFHMKRTKFMAYRCGRLG